VGIGTSIVVIAIGAILDFAVKVNSPNFNVNTVGLILMILGTVGLVMSFVFWNSWRGLGSAYQRRQVYRTGPGNTVVEERHQVF
jgi:ABC-type nickel/cobalt efflux system permease component RcnA